MGAAEVVGKAVYELSGDNTLLEKKSKESEGTLKRLAKDAKVALLAIGGAAGALFGIAAKNALELTNATAKWRAETGSTAQQAQAAQQTLNGLFRQNLQGYDELGATLAALQTDLGLTQDQAAKAAQSFLDFANATGINSTDAVKNLDDITAAYNLKATDSGKIMDLLVASHQKYGGSIQENTDALIKMGPALGALGVSVEQANGLLNLFADSGIKASAAQAAMNGAITKLPKGTSLLQFMQHLQNTKSDSKRAEEAIKVFGARAGPALAASLGKSTTALQDHVIKFRHVKGASKDAGDAIKNDFSSQAQLAIQNLTGFLGDIGTKFGPLLTAFAMLGPMLVPIMSGVGALAGAALDIGLALALNPITIAALIVAAMVAAAVIVYNDPKLRKQAEDIGGAVIGGIVKGITIGIPLLLAAPVIALAGLVDTITGKTGFAQQIIDAFTGIPDKVIGWVTGKGGLIEQGQQFFSAIYNLITNPKSGLVQKIIDGFMGIPGAVAAWATGKGSLLDQAAQLFSGFYALMLDPKSGLIPQFVSGLLGIPDKIAGMGAKIIDPIVSAFRDGINRIIGWWNSLDFNIPPGSFQLWGAQDLGVPGTPFNLHVDRAAIDWAGVDIKTPNITPLAKGMWNVPADGFLASLHRGEMVVPAGPAAALRGGRQTVDVRHTITLEGARNLRSAGFDESAVARLLRDAGDQGHHGFSSARR